jgi:hypothetical protein
LLTVTTTPTSNNGSSTTFQSQRWHHILQIQILTQRLLKRSIKSSLQHQLQRTFNHRMVLHLFYVIQ